MQRHPLTTKLTRSQLWSTLLGNVFEHYDTALYALLSPFIAPLFFPHFDPLTALIFTYAIIPLGMIVRPLGSLFFGYLGERFGYKTALMTSLFGMACISALMGSIPTYAQAGILAPLLLLACKSLQNVFSVGETIGGAVYLLSNTREQKHDLLSGIYSSSTIAGILLASAGVSFICYFDLLQEGWRILYFIGCLTAFFGCLLRSQISMDEKPRTVNPSIRELLTHFWELRLRLLTVAVVAGFSYATYSVALILMNGFAPLVANVTLNQIMYLNTGLLILDFATLPLFGWLASIYSRERMMLASAACATVTGIPLFMLLDGGTLATVIAMRVCLVIIGVWFSSTFHSWSQHFIPAAHRYSVIAFAYALGSQVFGGPTVSISLWLYHQTGIVSSAAWYWVALGGFSCLLIALQTYEKDIKDENDIVTVT
ncbi:MAG: MFS transporter [Parachlamydiaceae bacterium]|nr:MFS transporter [Parachlamydiaceae bacterium]